MRTLAFVLAAALSAATVAQPARPMTSAEFLSRAEPLLKKNMVSLMFSSEAKKLMNEVGAAAQATRKQQDVDRAARRQPATCLPAKGKAKVEAQELIAHLKSLTPAEKSRSFQSGFASYAARKYPCPKA